jgi:meiotic recombination protein SPO11
MHVSQAIFQTLCHVQLGIHEGLMGKGLIVTVKPFYVRAKQVDLTCLQGKGYPDMATRALIAHLSKILPETIPILALVDCDAYGLDILSVYKHGSQALRHENDRLATPRVRWIGLWASELDEYEYTPLKIRE